MSRATDRCAGRRSDSDRRAVWRAGSSRAGRRAESGRVPRLADARGSASLELALGTGVLLLPTALLALLLPTWIERQSAARMAAAEAARAFAVAAAPAEASGQALDLAHTVLGNAGIPGSQRSVTVAGTLVRGGSVTVTVTVTMPALPLPRIPAPGFSWTATHTERVDPYRSLP